MTNYCAYVRKNNKTTFNFRQYSSSNAEYEKHDAYEVQEKKAERGREDAWSFTERGFVKKSAKLYIPFRQITMYSCNCTRSRSQ